LVTEPWLAVMAFPRRFFREAVTMISWSWLLSATSGIRVTSAGTDCACANAAADDIARANPAALANGEHDIVTAIPRMTGFAKAILRSFGFVDKAETGELPRESMAAEQSLSVHASV
jgi:hypothetical protein